MQIEQTEAGVAGLDTRSRETTQRDADSEVNLSSFKVDGKIYDTQDWKQQDALLIERHSADDDILSLVEAYRSKLVLLDSKSTGDNDFVTFEAK